MDETTYTYNVKIKFDTEENKNFWISLLDDQKCIFNYASKILYNSKTRLDLKPVHDLLYNKLRTKYPSFSSQATIRTEKELISCYRSVKSNKHKITKFIEKKNLALRLDKRLYSNFTKESISIISSRPQKRCKISFMLYPKVIELFDKYKAKDPLIFYRNNEFYLSIPFIIPNKPKENQDILGGLLIKYDDKVIDLSLKGKFNAIRENI